MSEKSEILKSSLQESNFEENGFAGAGTLSQSPPAFSLTANPAAPPVQMQPGDRHYLREYGAGASNEEIMGTEEFKSLMNPRLVWQTQYDLSYEQSLNICRRILTSLDAGQSVDWQTEARRYVRQGMRDASLEETQQQPVADPTLSQIVSDFRTASAAATTTAELNTLAGQAGDRLWERGRSIAQPGVADADTDLYWARIQLRTVIRENALFRTPANLRQLNPIYENMERHSRGMHDIRWETDNENLKRVLVTGFDPFGGGNSNPSGILAQRLDGMTLQYGSDDVAIVEGVTFPVRYNEFDKGMVEEFAGPLLNDPEQNIFMVMTISLYGSNNHVHLDRFASRNRAGHADNSGVQSTTDPEVLPALGSGGDPQFIESRFPLREMLVDPNMPANVAVRQDGSYRDANGDLQTYDGGDDTVTPAEYREFANGNTTQDPLPPIPSGDITANEGPGGDYLSNEIFYRMSMLTRAVDGRNIPNIHLHIPRVGIRDEANNSRFTIDSILESARQTLAVAVRNHNP